MLCSYGEYPIRKLFHCIYVECDYPSYNNAALYI